MNLKFLFLIVLVSALVIPFMDIHIFTVTFAQTSDPSFKGNEPLSSLDSERNPKNTPMDATSSENNDTQSKDDNIISEIDVPTENIVTLSNNKTLDFNTSETEIKPIVTEEVSPSTTATETEIHSNEQEPVPERKSITVEEIPSKSTPSSKLEQEEQQQLEGEEATEEQNNVNKEKLNVKEICNDKIDNDQDGILDEEHECILLETGTILSNENLVPELATLGDKIEDEQDKEQIDKESSDRQSNEDEQKNKDTKKKENNKNDKDLEITSSKEICDDEMDNDLDGWIDEKEDCINE